MIRSGGRVALIGDIGGHADDLERVLDSLGVDIDSSVIPADLTVVQVGDLVHRGPDSRRVLDLVERFVRSPSWVQLIGNHEALYLGGPGFVHGGPDLDPVDVARLRSWAPCLRAAAGVHADGCDLLVTHAGLTAGFWKTIGSPATAGEAARRLNRLAVDDPGLLFTPGRVLAGEPVSLDAGPLWASCDREVYPSLVEAEREGTPVPFGQVHGHTSPYDWNAGRWYSEPSEGLHVDRRRRHVHGVVAGQAVTAIDPGLGRYGFDTWVPLILDDATIIEPARVAR